MPAPSKISQLPAEVREELDRRLIARGFSGYEGLEAWLAELGLEIGKSSIHRYGTQLEERLAALKMASEQAKAIVDAAPDDEGAVNEALMRLVQEKLFTVLMDLKIDPDKPLNLASAARAIAELGRASVVQKKWQAEVREKARTAADAAVKVAKKGGLSAESVAEIRKAILGIAS